MDKYKGHTPKGWYWKDYTLYGPNKEKVLHNPANAQLIADAPMLAEQVEELGAEKAKLHKSLMLSLRREDEQAEQNERMLAILKEHDGLNEYIGCGDLESRTKQLIAEVEDK